MSNTFRDALLRLPQVLEIIPVSKSTWYRGIEAGLYPRPLKIGAPSSAWRLSEIESCLEEIALGRDPDRDSPATAIPKCYFVGANVGATLPQQPKY